MPFDNGSQTPFLDGPSGELPSPGRELPRAWRETPFLSEYPSDEGEADDVQDEVLDELLDELHDEEFDQAVAELTEELRARAALQPELESHAEKTRETALRAALAPLQRAAATDLARVSEVLGALDPAAGEAEVEAALQAEALPEVDEPAFEFFLKGLRSKVRRLAGQAARLAARGLSPALSLALKPLLAKLQALVQPLLEKVLKFALDKVPEPYRPLATQLAARLSSRARAAAAAVAPAPGLPLAAGGASASPSSDAAPVPEPGAAPTPAEPATIDTGQAQAELDAALAEAALVGGQSEHEAGLAEAEAPALRAHDPYAELDRARERFVRELAELEDARETGPLVERFVPAVLMALRGGIRLVGRKRVVDTLGGLIGRFIAPLAGKANAPALGKVLADVGLRTFLQAETGEVGDDAGATRVLAEVVEETVRRVAQLPDEVLDESVALEAFAHEAFQGAAAANLPATLVRPALRETERPGIWLARPRRGRRRYRKFSHVFDVSVAPQLAHAVHGHGSATLAGHFRDRLRLPVDLPVRARLHLYEAVQGTSLAAIARDEDEVRGLGSAQEQVWSQLQPLTPEAAGLLLGEPRLGRELAEDAEPERPRVGQRYYYLEVAEAPARPLGRESHLHVSVDLRRDELRLCLYLSEVLAQRAAAALRAKSAAVVVVGELRAALAPTARAFARQRASGLVRVLGLGPRDARGAIWQPGARRMLRRQIAALSLQWAWRHLAAQLDALAAEFIAKTESAEDGLRLAFVFHLPGGLGGLRRALRGGLARAADWPPRGRVRTSLKLHAGPRHV